jgi:hypothetical protein
MMKLEHAAGILKESIAKWWCDLFKVLAIYDFSG